MAIVMIWLIALLCLWKNRSDEKLQEANDKLEARIKERTADLQRANERKQKKSAFIQLHKDIAVASNETRAPEDAIYYSLKRVCQETKWPVGHIYFPDENLKKFLIPSPIWFMEDRKRFEIFRKVTDETPLEFGEGLPGRVMVSGKPAWIMDVTKDENFPRAKLVANIEVRAGFAFPILIGSEVVGVMEFFSSEAIEPDEKLLEIMANIGTQLGRVIERKRAEEEQEKLLHSLGERVKELTCMYGVTDLVRKSRNPEEIFHKIGSFIVPAWQYPEITRVKVHFDGKIYSSKLFEETPWKQSSDIIINGKKRGSLEVYYMEERPQQDEGPFLKEERNLIHGLAHLLSEIYERMRVQREIERSHKQLRRLYHRLELVREEERTRIAREVHDELGQVLTTLKLELSLLDKKLLKGKSGLEKNTQLMLGLIDGTIQTVKRISFELRPPVLDVLGLSEAIRWQGEEYQKRAGIKFDFHNPTGEVDLDQDRSTTVFRIFQETLTNVVRHAHAEKVSVIMSQTNGTLVLEVKDDGKGIDENQVSDLKSLGILGMRERALGWGGQVDIKGTPGNGTTVTIKIPNKS
ncbi:MAG: ATP-binding protein [Nitrospinales bacterium]